MFEWDIIWNLIYPKHCPVCDSILKNQKKNVCPECISLWRPIREPRCYRCSKPLIKHEQEYCMDCSRFAHEYNAGISIFLYDKKKKASLIKFKYGGRREYADYYVASCLQYAGEKIKEWDIQGIIPIPMHPVKQRKRGFNQAHLLAEKLGKELKIPVYSHCLRKSWNKLSQKMLDASQRRSNLQHAFIGEEGIWNLDRVLLVDDVYTTGSTIDAAAKEIKRHGVKEVYFLTIFIGKGY